jgi:formate hydrogenlyase transcriptional activator
VLQEGEFERVGGTQTLKVDVRLIAATNRDLEQALSEGRFRADLYYRLNVFPIIIPPLRKRLEDVPRLARHFVMLYASKMGKHVGPLSAEVLHRLAAYAWPGNVRELQNVIERAVILSPKGRFELGELVASPAGESPKQPLRSLEAVERQHIVAVLEETGWRVSGERGAAKILGLKRTTLEARMKKLGIVRRPDRGGAAEGVRVPPPRTRPRRVPSLGHSPNMMAGIPAWAPPDPWAFRPPFSITFSRLRSSGAAWGESGTPHAP